MTNEDLGKYVTEIVSKAIKDNAADMIKMITASSPSADASTIEAALASIALSSKLSVEITMKVLDSLGALDLLSIEYDDSPNLTVIVGGLNPED